jgi:hypothetical protein
MSYCACQIGPSASYATHAGVSVALLVRRPLLGASRRRVAPVNELVDAALWVRITCTCSITCHALLCVDCQRRAVGANTLAISLNQHVSGWHSQKPSRRL